jgi:hypothetical protein
VASDSEPGVRVSATLLHFGKGLPPAGGRVRAAPYLLAHSIPRRTISRASGTSKSLAWWPSEQ